MKFGVREICDVVFKANAATKLGGLEFQAGMPVLYIDSAKTSTIEGAATTVYAQGGKGNARLIAWEGEKTLTFTVEDALLSPMGFAILSGAGLLKGADNEKVHVHMTTKAEATSSGIDLSNVLEEGAEVDADNIYVIATESDGSLSGLPVKGTYADRKVTATGITSGTVFVDYYVCKSSAKVSELQIDAENFAGNYYVEASTLFRTEDGKDLPAEITIPNAKIQSNFTFTMASTGDPSTFTFTMDAFPAYTKWNKEKKVLCAIQIIDDSVSAKQELKTVFPCNDEE